MKKGKMSVKRLKVSREINLGDLHRTVTIVDNISKLLRE
jgi:hypothetical protein